MVSARLLAKVTTDFYIYVCNVIIMSRLQSMEHGGARPASHLNKNR